MNLEDKACKEYYFCVWIGPLNILVPINIHLNIVIGKSMYQSHYQLANYHFTYMETLLLIIIAIIMRALNEQQKNY